MKIATLVSLSHTLIAVYMHTHRHWHVMSVVTLFSLRTGRVSSGQPVKFHALDENNPSQRETGSVEILPDFYKLKS